jgi:hypothetical protein
VLIFYCERGAVYPILGQAAFIMPITEVTAMHVMYCPNPHCVKATITERSEQGEPVQVFCFSPGRCIFSQPITALHESLVQTPDVQPPHRDGLLGVIPRRICHGTDESETVLQLSQV